MGEATGKILDLLAAEVHGVDYKAPSLELASFTQCDLRDESQIDAAVGALTGTIDAVFYCAGLAQTHPPLDVVTVNFIAMRHLVERVEPLLREGSSVVSISSVAGLGFPERMPTLLEFLETPDFDAARKWCSEQPERVGDGYGFSKQASIVFTMKKAMELVGKGIRINCTAPGPTATPMMPDFEEAIGVDFMRSYPRPFGRDATAEEQGWALAFLNSDAATYITGLNLVVDGGFTAGKTTGTLDLSAVAAAQKERLPAPDIQR
jgi:NAD(P)-dependent dehydrogenase (short-subunit alcohol dehydrogenase family)